MFYYIWLPMPSHAEFKFDHMSTGHTAFIDERTLTFTMAVQSCATTTISVGRTNHTISLKAL